MTEDQSPQDMLSRTWNWFKKFALYLALFIVIYAILKLVVFDVFQIHILPLIGITSFVVTAIIFFMRNKT
ncbi:MAG: hypothetical protein GF372_03775 [Candidatus Marinimicrobia bacterium]|nr:hypothetical protein [Candidatus Neomarinimicrobiota bacterium]